MGRVSPLSLGVCVLLGVAGAAMAGIVNNVAGTGVIDSDGPETTVALDDYLLGQDFVVLGSIDGSHHTAPGILPIRAGRVLLGAMPRQDITLIAIPSFEVNQRVLAWGTWVGAIEDTCYGGALAVGSGGEIQARGVRFRFTLDGVSVERAGALGRLRARLAAREKENVAGWLASGRAVALVRVASVMWEERLLGITPLATLAGADSRGAPHFLKLLRPCHFVGHVGDSLIIGIPRTPTDTLDVPTCLGRLQLRGIPYATVFGVRLDQLGQVLTPTPEGLRLNRIHGIDRRSP